jgi:hypothetical protein
MRQTIKLIIIIIVGGIAAIVITYCCWMSAIFTCFPRITSTIALVDVGDDRSVRIYTDSCYWEGTRPLWYEVRKAGKVIVPESHLDGDLGSQLYAFRVVSAENQSLVGVFDPAQSLFDYQFIIVDFKTGEAWPQPMSTTEKIERANKKRLPFSRSWNVRTQAFQDQKTLVPHTDMIGA